VPKATKAPKSLVFIDTTVLLDFYRVTGHRDALSILERVDKNLDSFIITGQVEMEFKKQRQSIILGSHAAFSAPKVPAFLSNTDALKDAQDVVDKLGKAIKARMLEILHKHSDDTVYATAERLFRHVSKWNLGHDEKKLTPIRRRAVRRFAMGYPPRKREDTSMGDAINWEWILHCAKEAAKDVVVVSGDSDYGRAVDGKPVMNDWLMQEFARRTARTVSLANGLASGLKAAGIAVTEQQEQAEKEFVRNSAAAQGRALRGMGDPFGIFMSPAVVGEELRKFETASAERMASMRTALEGLTELNSSEFDQLAAAMRATMRKLNGENKE
jgi:hypothetical protein